MKIAEFLLEDSEYRMAHRAPDSSNGAPLYDLSGVYPDDIYGPKAAQYYGHYGQNHSLDVETVLKIQRMRNRPNQAVQIYRAVPRDVKDINPGDWVTINRRYAKEHGEGWLEGDFKILSKIVSAKDLYTDGNSIHEWGYDPS